MVNQIKAGIGDGQDLLVKMPTDEKVEEIYSRAMRLRGYLEKTHSVYPKLDFKLGAQYTGMTLDKYNEGNIELGFQAQPDVCVPYTVKQTKEIPIERLWEVEALFEAEVDITEMEYAIKAHGFYHRTEDTPVGWKIEWEADAGGRDILDPKSLLTSAQTQDAWVGTGKPTQYVIQGGALVDNNNISEPAGVIAVNETDIENIEAKFVFETIRDNLEVKPGHTEIKEAHWFNSHGNINKDPGVDDDIVGIIFSAKDNKNFYCMLIEGIARTFIGGRSPASLNGMNLSHSMHGWSGPGVETQGKPWESHHGWKLNPDRSLPPKPTLDQWRKYTQETGWGTQHRKIYKVTNGVFNRIDTTPPGRKGGAEGSNPSVQDKGSGKGWRFGQSHTVDLDMYEGRAKLYFDGEEVFDFQVDSGWEVGTFGVMNISQAVKFTHISVKSRDIVKGEIPGDIGQEWGIVHSGIQTITEKKLSFIRSREDFIKKIRDKGRDPATAPITVTRVKLNDGTKGRIVSGELYSDYPVIIEAFAKVDNLPFNVRVPGNPDEWDSWKGIGTWQLAEKAGDYVMETVLKFLYNRHPEDSNIEDAVEIKVVKGDVKDPETGMVHIESFSPESPIILETINPPDAGEILTERHIYCDVVEITPDHRDGGSCLVVFEDIKMFFLEQKIEFFKREDLINEKEEYNLLIPEEQEEPEPEGEVVGIVTEGGCSIEEILLPEEQCWKDFMFDGESLCMWSCEFPIVVTVLDFKACAAKWEGRKEFLPINEFDHNPWSEYELFYDKKSIDPKYDTFKWKDTTSTRIEGKDIIIMETDRYYVALMDEYGRTKKSFYLDTKDKNTRKLELDIPMAPEKFIHPYDRVQMGHYESEIHYAIRVFDSDNKDIDIGWAKYQPRKEIYLGMLPDEDIGDKEENEILLLLKPLREKVIVEMDDGREVEIETEEGGERLDLTYKARAYINDNIIARPWDSGVREIDLSVNGAQPILGPNKGKKDLNDVDLMFVEFPHTIIESSIEGPFVWVTPSEANPKGSKIDYKIKDNRISFTSNTKGSFIEKTPYESDLLLMKEDQIATSDKKLVERIPSDRKEFQKLVKKTFPSNLIVEEVDLLCSSKLVELDDKSSISPWISAFNKEESHISLDIYDQVKSVAPLPWHPLVHNGYYYLDGDEYYLYASQTNEPIVESPHETKMKPQQGAPVIVDLIETDQLLTRVDSITDDAVTTTDEFIYKGENRFYLSTPTLRTNQIKAYVNGDQIQSGEYFIHYAKRAVEFLFPLTKGDHIRIVSVSKEAYSVDMNPEKSLFSSVKDISKITISEDISPIDMKTLAVYEGSRNTPFYRETSIPLNPLYSLSSGGFLYLDDKELLPGKIEIFKRRDFYDNRRTHIDFLIKVSDKNGTPIPNEELEIFTAGAPLKTVKTNQYGFTRFIDEVDSSSNQSYGHYMVRTKIGYDFDPIAVEVFNKTDTSIKERIYLTVEGPSLIKKGEVAKYKVTARDYNRNKTNIETLRYNFYDPFHQYKTNEIEVNDSEATIEIKPLNPGEYHLLFTDHNEYNKGTVAIKSLRVV